MAPWYLDPQSGGNKIPPIMYENIVTQINSYAAMRPWASKYQLKARFRGYFCYLDAVEEDGTIFPIGRLRYFSMGSWSLAFYTYSNERYEPCLFASGNWFGSIEEAIDICESYLV